VVFAAAGLIYTLLHHRNQCWLWAVWLLPLAALGLFYVWFFGFHGPTMASSFTAATLRDRWYDPGRIALNANEEFRISLHYFVLFMLPLVAFAGRRAGSGSSGSPRGKAPAGKRRRPYGAHWHVIVAVAFGIWLLGSTVWAALASEPSLMPYRPNIFYLEALLVPFERQAGSLPWWLTLVGLVSGLYVLNRLIRAIGPGSEPDPGDAACGPSRCVRHFLLAVTVLLVIFTLLTGGLHMDRYLLLAVPFLIPLCLPLRAGMVRWAVAVALLAAVSSFSFLFVDQRIRMFACQWAAAERVVALGYDPVDVNGGFAFNGYHSFPELHHRYRKIFARERPGQLYTPAFHPNAACAFSARRVPSPHPGLLLLCKEHHENRHGLAPYVLYLYRSADRPPDPRRVRPGVEIRP